jgi:hypothetical protein
MANDQKHLLVIARSTRLRPTLFVYNPVAFNICADMTRLAPVVSLAKQQQQNHNQKGLPYEP